MLQNIINLVKEKPRVLLLVVTLTVQLLEAVGVVIPPAIVETLNDILTTLVGTYVAYKSTNNSLV